MQGWCYFYCDRVDFDLRVSIFPKLFAPDIMNHINRLSESIVIFVQAA